MASLDTMVLLSDMASLSSKEELMLYCTLIMFTGSAQHASVNFMQYYSVPICQMLHLVFASHHLSRKVLQIIIQFLLDTLPDEDTAINSIDTTHLLSQYSQNEVYNMFTDVALLRTYIIIMVIRSSLAISSSALWRSKLQESH